MDIVELVRDLCHLYLINMNEVKK